MNRTESPQRPPPEPPDTGRSDAELVEAILARTGTGADLVLYNRYKRDVYTHLRRQLPAVIVDDTFQVVWRDTFRALSTFDLERSFRAWLLGITFHRIRNTRRDLRRRGAMAELTPDTADTDHVPVDVQLDRARAVTLLEDCVRRLSGREAQMLAMVRDLGMNLREVADELGMKHPAARKSMSRIYARLRRCLESKGVHGVV